MSKESTAAILKRAQKEGRSYVLEPEVKEIMASYGVPVTRERVCTSVEEAKQAAAEIGYPVVAKIVSPQVVHKSDAGGVVVGISSAAEMEAAYHAILKNVRAADPKAEVRGVLVGEMSKGEEIIVGSINDEQFGQVMMFGIGGIFVEIYKDVAYRLVPLEPLDAREMIEEIKGYPLLTGARGRAPVDLPSLQQTLLNISRFLNDFPDIKEMDLNPVFVSERGVKVADGRIILG